MSFSERILSWYKTHKRALPWRETKNPYVIWLSEIILQQTRVEQGLPYFLRFVENFPNVTKFASAEESEILRYWQGLGYYSRARNMHKASQYVMQHFGGEFPVRYSDLLQLPGVGEYTAAAIASFSANEAKAVLDGNVFRVLSRYFGLDEAINSGKGKKLFSALATEMLDQQHPAEYNQAIMDFGALQCKPKNPNCEDCVLRIDCVALQEDRVAELPKKIKTQKSRIRYFHYFISTFDGAILMSQRGSGDIWTNLFEFPLIETEKPLSIFDLQELPAYQEIFPNVGLQKLQGPIKHVLSHQHIYANFYALAEGYVFDGKKNGWNYCLLENLDKLAKHKLISSFLESYENSAN